MVTDQWRPARPTFGLPIHRRRLTDYASAASGYSMSSLPERCRMGVRTLGVHAVLREVVTAPNKGAAGLIRPAADALDVLSRSIADVECAGRPLNRRPGLCSTILGAGFCAAAGWTMSARRGLYAAKQKTAFLVAGGCPRRQTLWMPRARACYANQLEAIEGNASTGPCHQFRLAYSVG